MESIVSRYGTIVTPRGNINVLAVAPLSRVGEPARRRGNTSHPCSLICFRQQLYQTNIYTSPSGLGNVMLHHNIHLPLFPSFA